MKRVFTIFLLTLLLLSGCGKKAEIVVNPHTYTISDGSYTYEYTDTVDGDNRIIVITYPNGRTYTWKKQGSVAVAVPVTGQDMHLYTSGSDLVDAIVNPETQTEKKTVTWLNVVLFVLGGVFVAGGLWNVCRPDQVWNIFFRRFYEEEAGPYAMTRIVSRGVGLIVVGILNILFGIFGF